jgi:dTDP-4-dehydrorhamnose 3,5-epimerase
LVLSKESEVQYKCTAEYEPSSDGGIRFDDTRLNIPWPIDISDAILSEKDISLPMLHELGKEFSL